MGDFSEDGIYGESGSGYVQSHDHFRWRVLLHGIPAESFAAGANPVNTWNKDEEIDGRRGGRHQIDKEVRNINMAIECRRNVSGNMEEDWVHSYFIQRSLHDTSMLYEKLVGVINKK